MTLTPRQMLFLLVLIVGFGVAAYVVSRDDGAVPAIDHVAWCEGADGLVGTGPIFTGVADDVSIEELEATKLALFDVETLAPYDVRAEIATLADFSLIAKQKLEGLAWPEAYAAARENKEEAIDAAVEALDLEVTLCGLRLGG